MATLHIRDLKDSVKESIRIRAAVHGRSMEAEARDISGQGYRIKLTVEKNQTHRLKAPELGLSKRLFDEIESCR